MLERIARDDANKLALIADHRIETLTAAIVARLRANVTHLIRGGIGRKNDDVPAHDFADEDDLESVHAVLARHVVAAAAGCAPVTGTSSGTIMLTSCVSSIANTIPVSGERIAPPITAAMLTSGQK